MSKECSIIWGSCSLRPRSPLSSDAQLSRYCRAFLFCSSLCLMEYADVLVKSLSTDAQNIKTGHSDSVKWGQRRMFLSGISPFSLFFLTTPSYPQHALIQRIKATPTFGPHSPKCHLNLSFFGSTPPVLCWCQLVLPPKNRFWVFLPNSEFKDVTLIAWNWLWWEYKFVAPWKLANTGNEGFFFYPFRESALHYLFFFF